MSHLDKVPAAFNERFYTCSSGYLAMRILHYQEIHAHNIFIYVLI